MADTLIVDPVAQQKPRGTFSITVYQAPSSGFDRYPLPEHTIPTMFGIGIPASNVPEELAAFRREHIHHPGGTVGLHTTMIGPLDRPFGPEEQTRLQNLARSLEPFHYDAGFLCSFPSSLAYPTSEVLWLSPSPQTGFEAISEALEQEFPEFSQKGCRFPYHMTVALGPIELVNNDLAIQFENTFGAIMPFRLRAEEMCVSVETDGWRHLVSAPFRGC